MPAQNTEEEEKKDKREWFAMRATYRRELTAKADLEKAGFKVYIPMAMVEVKDKKTKKPKRTKVPAIHSLIFVYANPVALQYFKNTREYIQYIVSKGHTDASHKITIPDEQMEAFIKLYEHGMAKVVETTQFTPGTPVRITSGPFEGMTGTFQRINGYNNRYFVITLDGLISIGSALIRPNMVEKISK